MSLYIFNDYRLYLRQRLAQMPRKGRGQVLAIARALGVQSSLVSQVLSGAKDFTLEQGQALCSYLGLTELEEDYLLTLLHHQRAGTVALKKYYRQRLEKLRRESLDMSKRLERDRELNEEEKAQFYSDWIYSAVRLMTAIKGLNTVDRLAHELDLPVGKVSQVLGFLVRSGLLVERGGVYEIGLQKTYVGQNSPYVRQHHINWRMRAMNRSSVLTTEELMFTCPAVVSDADFHRFREELAALIQRFYKLAGDSPSERLACLNVDWFFVR